MQKNNDYILKEVHAMLKWLIERNYGVNIGFENDRNNPNQLVVKCNKKKTKLSKAQLNKLKKENESDYLFYLNYGCTRQEGEEIMKDRSQQCVNAYFNPPIQNYVPYRDPYFPNNRLF